MQTQRRQPQEVEIGSTLQLFDIVDVVRSMLDAVKTPRLALKLRRLARDVQTALDDVMEQERAILRECGVKEDENGFVFQRDAEGNATNEFAFNEDGDPAEMRRRRDELHRTPVTISCVPLPASLFEASGVALSGRDALVLGDLLEDDFDEPGEEVPHVPDPV